MYNNILGVGTDLCNIQRIEKTLDRFGDRFTERIYSEDENLAAQSKAHPASTYAKFFAAKESFSKALGTGFREGVFWRNIEVKHLPSGQPFLNISGGALSILRTKLPLRKDFEIHISLTDEYPLAHSIVIISVIEPAKL